MNEEELKFWQEVEQQIVVPKPLTIEYRLHYDIAGNIYLCTMIDHPADTEYLVVNKKIYDNYYRYQVKDKKLKMIETDSGYRTQLYKSDSGFPVIKNHAGLLLENIDEYSEVEYYARNN